MAVQSYLVGVFFCIGLISGLIINSMVIGYNSIVHVQAKYAAPTNNTRVTNVIIGNRSGASAGSVVHRPPLTHEELDKLPGIDHVIEFGDHHHHKDDDAVARELYNKTRVMAWIMTSPENLEKKAKHVKATWAKRFNKAIFVSDEENLEFPTVKIKVEHGRDHLTAKTMAAFDYVYKHHFDDADWFMKADDDTYVIVENLRYLLSDVSPDDPVYFGHHFKVIVNQGYFSGGAGYVVSREALRRFAGRKPGQCAEDHGAEDVEFGRCMEKLGVRTGDSRDSLGRSRFHCFNPETHLHGGYPDWYYQYDKYGAKKGQASMSDYPITFHYVSVENMYNLEYFVYHLRPYGIENGLQDLNNHERKTTERKVQMNLKPTTPPKLVGLKQPKR